MTNKIINVCIIDDDEVYIYSVIKLIKSKGLCGNLMVFKSGFEALNHLKSIIKTPNLLPDIILLDINMPKMDGWQFVEEFNKLNSKTGKKVIIHIVSSSIDVRDESKANSLSVISNYYFKPVTREMLDTIFQNADI
ncbi:MAG: response regulator [Bacteroidetes bacterium]|nr:response regulator [Bacteroidota bacterium]MBU1372370.1 response regulator [Bacteroidota bacterium]MBU1483394.1 response regulator [Bacteroidota bacterium]MBU1761679.1 response regulator [Bacteroidota bacterium]MBU2046961.1 response regulator [Bacteroidota bacterium]